MNGTEQTIFRKEDYLRLVDENQDLRKKVEFLRNQNRRFRQELLQERLWRIEFQMNYLKQLAEASKTELEEIDKRSAQETEEIINDKGM